MKNTKEKQAFKINGFFVLFSVFVLFLLDLYLFISGVNNQTPSLILGGVFLSFIGVIILIGLIAVQPNEARVLTFFGKYIGSVTDEGFYWVNPFSVRKKVSLRVKNFNSERLKVNDSEGNPIEISAIVVWRVVDSASAVFNVDDFEEFVAIQSEIAIRTLSSNYPYDNLNNNEEITLRGTPEEIALTLKKEITNHLQNTGIIIMEARLSHLAYSSEIAQAMLRRQQAQAIISARQKIVEGAVGMVETALQLLSSKNIVELDEERKAVMVNNLMVALVSETEAQPVINAGTLY